MLKLTRSNLRVNTFFHINYSVDSQKWNIWRSPVTGSAKVRRLPSIASLLFDQESAPQWTNGAHLTTKLIPTREAADEFSLLAKFPPLLPASTYEIIALSITLF